MSIDIEKLKQAFWEDHVAPNTFGTHPSGPPRDLWYTFTALRPKISEQYVSRLEMWTAQKQQSQHQQQPDQALEDSEKTIGTSSQTGTEASTSTTPSTPAPSMPQSDPVQTAQGEDEAHDRLGNTAALPGEERFVCVNYWCKKSETFNPGVGGNNGVRCTACCQIVRSIPGMRCVWASAVRDITSGTAKSTSDIVDYVSARHAACALHIKRTKGGLCLCPPAFVQGPSSESAAKPVQFLAFDPADTFKANTYSAHQPQTQHSHYDQSNQAAHVLPRPQAQLDAQQVFGQHAGSALATTPLAPAELHTREQQDRLWEESFLKIDREHASLPVPPANASAEQLLNYINAANPPLWHLLPDRVPAFRSFVDGKYIYHFTENATKALQRRGSDWAFFMGKQAEFGFHSGTAGGDCVACRKMFIASGKEMGIEVLARIHKRQMGQSG